MNVKEIDCAYVEQHDLAALYLAGALPQSEAEAFEAHYFGCERCFGEVRSGGEIRFALGHPAIARASEKAKSPLIWSGDVWSLVAAAAAVAVIVLGIRQLAERPEIIPESHVVRGERVESLDLTVKPGPSGQVILEWSARPDILNYRLEVFRSDGLAVLKREVSGRRVELDIGATTPRPPGIDFLVKVEGLDAANQVVAESELKPLPAP